MVAVLARLTIVLALFAAVATVAPLLAFDPVPANAAAPSPAQGRGAGPAEERAHLPDALLAERRLWTGRVPVRAPVLSDDGALSGAPRIAAGRLVQRRDLPAQSGNVAIWSETFEALAGVLPAPPQSVRDFTAHR